MAFFLNNLLRLAARKLASNPVVREKASQAAHAAAQEAGKIVRDKDPGRAAGRAFQRAINKVRGD